MRYRCLKNDTVVLTFLIWTSLQHRFDSQLGGQFVLKVATVFTNTRPQSNTPLLDGIVNDSLWEMVPLFDQFFQLFHVVNPALVDALLVKKFA